MTQPWAQPSTLRKTCLVAAAVAAIVLGSLVPAWGTMAQAGEAYAAEMAGDPDIAIAYVGAEEMLRIEVRNAGVETWRAGQVVLSNVDRPLDAEATRPLAADTPPGQTAKWEFQVRAPDSPGVYKSEWQLGHADEAFGPTLSAYLIVLPEGASELEQKIRDRIEEWRQQAEREIDDLIDELRAMIVAEVKNFFEKLVDDLCGNVCGASALIVLGILLLWWRRR
jgi:hypothetical protein